MKHFCEEYVFRGQNFHMTIDQFRKYFYQKSQKKVNNIESDTDEEMVAHPSQLPSNQMTAATSNKMLTLQSSNGK